MSKHSATAAVSSTPLLLPLSIACALAGCDGGSGGGSSDPVTALKTVGTRVTQGLDVDVGDKASIPYDLVAGTDTLLRVEFEGSIPADAKTAVTCNVARFGGNAPDLTAKPTWSGTAETRELAPATASTRRFQADCWIPGRALHPAAAYSFDVVGQVTSQPQQALFSGSKSFNETGDVRLLVFPTTWPDGDIGASEAHPWIAGYCRGMTPKETLEKCAKVLPTPIYRAWDAALAETVIQTIDDFNRVMPVRTGVGQFDFDGAGVHTAATPGLRYWFAPITKCTQPYAIRPPADPWPGIRDALGPCDYRSTAALAVMLQNAKLGALDSIDFRHRDRFDKSIVVTPTNPSTTGGQCKDTDLVGSEIDDRKTGPSSFVLVQELGHCLGSLIQPASPHSNAPGDPSHSRNRIIPLVAGLPLVNMLTQADVFDPLSAMFNSFDDSMDTSRIALEGYEWNSMRQTFLTMPRADSSSTTYKIPASAGSATTAGALVASREARKSSQPAIATPVYVIAGTMDSLDRFRLDYSQRVNDLALPVTAPDPDGSYALVLRDASGQELSRLPFDRHSAEHDHEGGGSFAIILVVPVTGEPARIELEKDRTVLFRLPVAQAAPQQPAHVEARVVPDKSEIEVAWDSANASAGLLYNVFYQHTADRPEILVAAGLTDSRYRFSTFLLGATQDARILIEVSNGYRAARGTSGALSIPAQPPIVSIRSPFNAGRPRLAGDSITLIGTAFDFTFGVLSDRELVWKSDKDGFLGEGARVSARLSAGLHRLTLEAKSAASPASSSTSVSVNVAAKAK